MMDTLLLWKVTYPLSVCVNTPQKVPLYIFPQWKASNDFPKGNIFHFPVFVLGLDLVADLDDYRPAVLLLLLVVNIIHKIYQLLT